MLYTIYFDESGKLDKNIDSTYSYYAALIVSNDELEKINTELKEIYPNIERDSELHFAEYKNDNHFEKYYKVIKYFLYSDISVNLFVVNNEEAFELSGAMNIDNSKLRELFYVKIPERLFYGLTRSLNREDTVEIILDKNDEYSMLQVEEKVAEQMTAHSVYRNIGYQITGIRSASSDNSLGLQIVDVFMGIVVFLIEEQYNKYAHDKITTTNIIKSDLIYRILIENNNFNSICEKIRLFRWENGKSSQIIRDDLSHYLNKFIIYKSSFDIKEMNKLQKLNLDFPDENTKFYREKMGYKNQQLRMLLGYKDELENGNRNFFFNQ